MFTEKGTGNTGLCGVMRQGWIGLLLVMLGGCGGGGADATVNQSPAAIATLELLVGYIGGHGNIDGTAFAARSTSPTGVVADDDGNAMAVWIQDIGVQRNLRAADAVVSGPNFPRAQARNLNPCRRDSIEQAR